MSLYARANGTAASGTAPSASAAAATTTALTKAQKLQRTAHRMDGAVYKWYVIAGVVFALFAVYVLGLVRAFVIRRRVARARAAGTAPTHGKRKGLAAARAAKAALDNLAFVRVLPLYLYQRTTVAEAFWTLAYIGVCLGFGFWGSIFGNLPLDIANPMGLISMSQIPLVVGLASRNNVLSYLTGISYEKLNFLHRTAARVLVLSVALHAFTWIHRGLPGTNNIHSDVVKWGISAGCCLLVVFFTSFAVIRRVAYEAFLFIHIVFVLMFLVAVYHHYEPYNYWVWPGLFLWGLDRFVGFARLAVVNKLWFRHSASIELVDTDVLRVTVNRPLLRWSAGQHAFLTMPQVAGLRYEQHPFTMANVPDGSGNAVFLLRAQAGFTRRLVNKLTDQVSTTINTYVEGPYGISHDMNHYDSVLLVAGGTGVTFALAHLLSIVKAGREGASAVSHVRLVWNLREAGHARWIAPLLNDALAAGSGTVRVALDFYVTRSEASGEPEEKAHTADRDPQPDADSPASRSDDDEKDTVASASKYATAAGLNAAAAAVASFHTGRSHVEHILREDVEGSAVDAAGVHVAVCGPTSLALDTRRAVCKVNAAGAVLRGQNPVTFASETFGW
ncbi:ferric-chelate reductase Frp1 [Vanrija albida]|uniref:ferric-chelate reductase (NADPH) n=1 Tax=Vanrija albida TaxID=181172 RepID=A0ABR3Q790_9TREE